MRFFLKILYNVFFVFGASFSFFLVYGLVADLRGIDKTKSVTDEVVQIEAFDFATFFTSTETGVIKHGFVSDYHINCVTGSLVLKIHGYKYDSSHFLKRAFKKYRPKDICIAGGFDPTF